MDIDPGRTHNIELGSETDDLISEEKKIEALTENPKDINADETDT